ncbi:hypothetical protein V500_01949 [Pseudogymnoascus sp. VKM F-4518 (FW-2643)]|nr:hypothetical protein V500_01949 [Pseudogymnoascus sp. VKM F-4518 (FW-2643)]
MTTSDVGVGIQEGKDGGNCSGQTASALPSPYRREPAKFSLADCLASRKRPRQQNERGMTAARDPKQATGAFDGFGYLCEIELKVCDGKEGGRVRIEERGAWTTYTSKVEEKRRGVDRQAVMPKPSTPN